MAFRRRRTSHVDRRPRSPDAACMPPPAPTPRYFDVLRLLFFRRNSFHLRRYTLASRESDVAAHATNKAPQAAATAAAMRRSCMVSIWSAALLRLIYVRACPRPLRNKLCVTTAENVAGLLWLVKAKAKAGCGALIVA